MRQIDIFDRGKMRDILGEVADSIFQNCNDLVQLLAEELDSDAAEGHRCTQRQRRVLRTMSFKSIALHTEEQRLAKDTC